jgi:hypothetical protein
MEAQTITGHRPAGVGTNHVSGGWSGLYWWTLRTGLVWIEARAEYKLYVVHSNGRAGEIDISDVIWGPVFEPLRDPAFFAKVRLNQAGVPSWPNGADLAPEFIDQKLSALFSRALDRPR